MRILIYIFTVAILAVSCGDDKSNSQSETAAKQMPKPVYKFGYKIDDYIEIQDTIAHGESFGEILDRHHVWYPEILKISKTVKKTFDVRRIRAGKPLYRFSQKGFHRKGASFYISTRLNQLHSH